MESLVILLAGTVVGFIAGLFGVGGSFLLVPLLAATTSLPAEIIVGSCACQVLGPATTATMSRNLRLRDWQIPLILLGGIVSGTLLGSDLLCEMERNCPADQLRQTIQVYYLVLLWLLGLFSYWESRRQNRGQPLPIGWLKLPALKPTCQVFARQQWETVSIVSLAGFGILVGLLSGLLGLSGGVILVPGLHYFYGISTKRSAHMSMILVGMIAVQAIFIHAGHNRIDLEVVVWLLLGGTVGAQAGVQMAEKMTGGALRQQFAWLILVAAVACTYTVL